ncbi:MAG: hypothetical protein HN348_14775 [Proteobacteria bacterium]|nr:hypothetical protein [Pseudomonadota bacterium]
MFWILTQAALAVLPSLSVPLKTGVVAPVDAAVVVGLEDYAFVPDVPYAQADAELFAALLVQTVGVPEERVQVLTNGGREQIIGAVEEAADLARDGTLWVYFAGHGAADPSTGERMLLGDDVKQDPSVFAKRGLKVSVLESLAKRRLILVLDTCYAGTGRSGESLVAGTRFLVPDYAQPPTKGVLEWTAAGPSELSTPFEAVGHGAFTWFAVGALRGWADGELDGNRNKEVTAREAEVYVARMLRALDQGQHPSLNASQDGHDERLVRKVDEVGPPEVDVQQVARQGRVSAAFPAVGQLVSELKELGDVKAEIPPWEQAWQATIRQVIEAGDRKVLAGFSSEWRHEPAALGLIEHGQRWRKIKDPRRGGPVIGEGVLDDAGVMGEPVKRGLWQEVMFRYDWDFTCDDKCDQVATIDDPLKAVRFYNALSALEGLPPPYRIDGETFILNADVWSYRMPSAAELPGNGWHWTDKGPQGSGDIWIARGPTK